MTTTPLSNANSGYLKTVLNSSPKTPPPQVVETQSVQQTKKNGDNFPKVLLCLAALGTLVIQGIALSRKPSEIKGDNEQIKVINETLSSLRKAVDELSKNANKDAAQKVELPKLDELVKSVETLQKKFEKGNNDKSVLDGCLKTLSQIEQDLAKLQNAPAQSQGVDEKAVETLLQKTQTEISKFFEELRAQISALSERVDASKVALEEAGKKNVQSVQKSVSNAKNQVVEAQKQTSAVLDGIVKKQDEMTQAINGVQQTQEGMAKSVASVASEVGTIHTQVDKTAQKVMTLDEINEICKKISAQQGDNFEITQGQFSDLINSLNIFTNSKKVSLDEIEFKTASKLPFLKGTNEIFSGVATKQMKDGSQIEMVFVDGKVLQSKKTDKEGRLIFEKFYLREKKQAQNGRTNEILKVITNDGTTTTRVLFSNKISPSDNPKSIKQILNRVLVDEKTLTKREISQTISTPSFTKVKELDGDKKIERILTVNPEDGAKKIEVKEGNFSIIEEEPNAREPYKFFGIR